MPNRYNPDVHHRRSIRLPGYDYTLGGAYFLTLCTYRRECLFGEIANDGTMRSNDLGNIVQACWEELPAHSPNLALDAFVIMPNHVHAIANLVPPNVGARHASPLPRADRHLPPTHPAIPPHGFGPQSLGAVVASLKSASTRRINMLRRTPGAPVWQRNYYEHVIRDEPELNRIREYIAMNPSRWSDDELNPAYIPQTAQP